MKSWVHNGRFLYVCLLAELKRGRSAYVVWSLRSWRLGLHVADGKYAGGYIRFWRE